MDSGVENQVVLDLFSEWLSFNALRSTLSVLRAGEAPTANAASFMVCWGCAFRPLQGRLFIGRAGPHNCLS